MIVLGITAIWLTLTAAGFAGLSLLGRAAARERARSSRTPSELQKDALLDVRAPIPEAVLG